MEWRDYSSTSLSKLNLDTIHLIANTKSCISQGNIGNRKYFPDSIIYTYTSGK